MPKGGYWYPNLGGSEPEALSNAFSDTYDYIYELRAAVEERESQVRQRRVIDTSEVAEIVNAFPDPAPADITAYFLAPSVFVPEFESNQFDTPINGANRTNVFQFILPFDITVTRGGIFRRAYAGAPTFHFSFGLYNFSKQAVLRSPVFTVTSGAAAQVHTTTFSPTRVLAGVYYSAFTMDVGPGANAPTFLCFRILSFASDFTSFQINAGPKGVIMGQQNSPTTSGGALPTSIGTIVDTDNKPPLVMYDSIT